MYSICLKKFTEKVYQGTKKKKKNPTRYKNTIELKILKTQLTNPA